MLMLPTGTYQLCKSTGNEITHLYYNSEPEVGNTELLLYRITEPNYFFCTGTGTDRYF